MPPLTARVEQAARWALESSTPPQHWNPVYRALVPDPPPAPLGAPGEADVGLVVRQLTAPALLVVALSHEGSTRRLRIAAAPGEATLESSRDDEPSQWQAIPVELVPAAIGELLADAGVGQHAPHLNLERASEGLRLTSEQITQVHRALRGGSSPEEAFALAARLDERLRDALTASGPRLSLSLTLHDPSGTVTEESVTWSRLWVRGERGLYRMDAADAPLPLVHPVDDGDMLGTALSILEEGVRFAAACAAQGGAR